MVNLIGIGMHLQIFETSLFIIMRQVYAAFDAFTEASVCEGRCICIFQNANLIIWLRLVDIYVPIYSLEHTIILLCLWDFNTIF